MKQRFGFLLVLVLAAASLQAQTKLGTVNLKKVFDNYWRTKASSAELQTTTAVAEQDLQKLVEPYQKANEAYRLLMEKVNDAAISAAEKEKLKATAQIKAADLRVMEKEINDFLQGSRTRIGNKQQMIRLTLLAEINQVVTAKSKAAGYELVFDTSGETSNSVAPVLYSAGKNDLTDAVLAELNASAPADTAKPPAKPEASPEPKPEAKPGEKKSGT